MKGENELIIDSSSCFVRMPTENLENLGFEYCNKTNEHKKRRRRTVFLQSAMKDPLFI